MAVVAGSGVMPVEQRGRTSVMFRSRRDDPLEPAVLQYGEGGRVPAGAWAAGEGFSSEMETGS